jgi:uncharacterized protein
MTEAAGPIPTKDRIFELDVIRGVALLGIFIMNMPFFNTSLFANFGGTPLWPQWWDRSAEVTRDVLFAGKFNSMFSMLFAIGFTIQLGRLEERDPKNATRFYLRRVGWLFVFGLIHACVFWIGDILHMYALFGFVLLAVRRVHEKVLWGLAIAAILYAPLFGIVQLLTLNPAEFPKMMAEIQAWIDSNNLAFGKGSFLMAVHENTRMMTFFYTDPVSLAYMSTNYAQIATTMLIGLILGRRKFFQDTGKHLVMVRRVQWWSLAIGICTGVYFGAWGVYDKTPMVPSIGGLVAGTCFVICRVTTMAFYVTTLIRGVNSQGWRSRLVPFAVIGRMPLTNYLMQTLLCTFIFFGWGLGFWGTVGPALDIVLAVAIYFIIQMPLSHWWLKRFELGPMEYLWRVLTYGTAKLRKEPAIV